MLDAEHVLLVEAQSDKDFIERLIHIEQKQDADFLKNVRVQVAIPTELSNTEDRTNKQAVLKQLPTLIKSLNDGKVKRIGVLIDMDSEGETPLTHNLEKISECIKPHGFTLDESTDYSTGISFKSVDFDPIGIWLMPNNQDAGYLETWIENCITDKANNHFDKAEGYVSSLINANTEHFAPVGITKAKVYTWLASQHKPRNDLRQVLNHAMIDKASENYVNFKAWLVKTFEV